MKQVKRQRKFKREKWYKGKDCEICICRLFQPGKFGEECVILKKPTTITCISDELVNRPIDATALFLLMDANDYFKMMNLYTIEFY